LHWTSLLEEYGVPFVCLLGKKNVGTVADALSCLDIDSLTIQEDEVLTLLSGSENSSNSNIKFPIHTTLIFKGQAEVNIYFIWDSQEQKRLSAIP
jgi:hypothetical protein